MVIGTVSGEINRLESKVVGLETTVGGLETKVDDGFVEVKNKFSDVNLALGGLGTKVADVSQALERIEKALASPAAPPLSPGGAPGTGNGSSGDVRSYANVVAASPPLAAAPHVARDVTTPSFNRQTDPTKLFSNCKDKEKVSKNKFVAAINALAFEAGLKDSDVVVSGNNLDDRFELQFTGDPRAAAAKTLQFYESLQLGGGEWKPQFVPNDAGTSIQFYIAPDKNPCQMRREILAKLLKDILQGLATTPDTKFFVKKATGSVYANKRVVVSVIITGPESARLDWCHAKRIELGIEQGPAESAFGQYVVSGPGS